MARTINEIYDSMVNEKDNQVPSLTPNNDTAKQLINDVDSGSKVAVWRLFFYILAVSIHVMETVIDNVRSEIEEARDKTPVATTTWYSDRALEYRHGYALQFIDREYKYGTVAVNDTGAAVVKRSASNVNGGQVRVKVADLDANDDPVKLNSSQKSGVEGYFAKIKPAGIDLAVISENADLLRVTLEVKYDPLVLDENGKKINDTSLEPARDAVKGYVGGLEFDAILNLTSMVDAIQEADGVRDVILEEVEAKADTASNFQKLFDVTGTGVKQKDYETLSGHMKIDQFNVTYTPNA